MAIKEQCDNCNKNGRCGEDIVFNSESCPMYARKETDQEEHTAGGINLDKAGIEESATSPTPPSDESHKETVYTREYLKENTKIHGWLSFFCFTIFAGGAVSVIYPIVTFNINDYGGSYILGLSDVIFGVLLFLLAIITLYALYRRDTDAILLAKTYVIACFISNLAVLIIGNYEKDGIGSFNQIIRSLTWSVIWFSYLLRSSQVKENIPSEYRKAKTRDWYIIGALILIPLFLMAWGIHDAVSEEGAEATEMIQQKDLAKDELTDGRVVFKKAAGFACSDTIVEDGLKLFSLEDEDTGTYITLCSDYDQDQSGSNFNSYWEAWEDDSAKQLPASVTLSEKRHVNGHSYYYKVKKYDVNGDTRYWRYVMMFDDSSAKICIISSYDSGMEDYLQALLKSIRFE